MNKYIFIKTVQIWFQLISEKIVLLFTPEFWKYGFFLYREL